MKFIVLIYSFKMIYRNFLRTLKISIKIILLIVCLFWSSLAARDINLDEIYIKKTSNNFKKLTLEKMDTYRIAGAVLVDRNIIFSDWISGNEIIYIKENDSTNTNYIYKYKLLERKATELCRLHGVITVADITPGGRFLILKRLVQTTGVIPRGERIVLDIQIGKINVIKTSYAFLDYSIPADGNSIIFETEKGISELVLDTNNQRELLKRKNYKDIIISDSPVLAFISPDRKKIIVLNGNGGNYKAKLIWDEKSYMINSISSSSEIFWIDNFSLIYRTGYAGNYSVMLHNLKNNKVNILLKKSLNTNICFSAHPEIVSFLREQVIFLFDKKADKLINTGIEGEDISFAPNGNSFTSLLFKKLFIVSSVSLEKKRIELKRSWNSILSAYENLKNNSSEFENEYSLQYVNRKIQIYKELSGI